MYYEQYYFYEDDYEYALGHSDYWKCIWNPPSLYSGVYFDYVDGWEDAEDSDYYFSY